VDHLREFNDNYRIFSLTLPAEMNFCDEIVPLEKIHVRESLDRELLVNTYWQSNSILNHKRAARWFPLIEEILEEEGVPKDLQYIALIESGLTNVVSPAGATGFWQFLRATGIEYGLEINGEVDERYHVGKATRAACRYLKDAYKRYGSWTLAAASYNMGMNGLEKQLARQKTDDYYELLLVEETSRYVFRALALKEILKDPERYGFHIRKQDLYSPYDTREVIIEGAIPDFADFARNEGTDYKTLKLLNPWLRENFLTNSSGKSYTVLLPGKKFNDLPSAE
jgi:transposase